MRFHLPITAALLLGCAPGPPLQAVPSDLAIEVRDEALRLNHEYVGYSGTKSLVACLHWPEAAGDPVEIDFASSYRTSQGSDLQIMTSTLDNLAINACEEIVAKYELGCDCATVDKNGKPVLRAPASVAFNPDTRSALSELGLAVLERNETAEPRKPAPRRAREPGTLPPPGAVKDRSERLPALYE